MAYASVKYYEKNHGKAGREGLEELLQRASDMIDGLTHNRIRAVGFGNLTDFQKKAVRRACCLMVDGMAAAGQAPDADIESFWMQDVRINMRRRKLKPWEAAGVGMWAWMTLLQTGLMRGNVG